MKLYVLVRSDLHVKQRWVQACHAVAEHCLTCGTWVNNSLVILKVSDEDDLQSWWNRLHLLNYTPKYFREPHFKHTWTALAVNGEGLEEIFKDLELL